MAEYIDREKLLRDIEKYHLSDGKFQHWVEIQPTVDVEHVIRCRDCKYWSDRDGIYTTADGVRYARCRMHNNEHLSGLHEGWCPKESCYCSLGERKENINGNKNN